MTKILTDILKLSEAERILLVEAIWDSIGQQNTVDEISTEQETQLKKRLESFRNNPKDLLTWEEVKVSIRK